MEEKHHYHVFYVGLSNQTGQQVQCTVTILSVMPIQYQSDLNDIKAYIETNYNVSDVAIVNWMPLLGLERAESKCN